jgi:hypothetical protein
MFQLIMLIRGRNEYCSLGDFPSFDMAAHMAKQYAEFLRGVQFTIHGHGIPVGTIKARE